MTTIKMVRVFVAAGAALGLAALGSGTVQATSGAHFFRDTSASVNSDGSLSVTIDEAGVGQQTVDYTLSGTDSATYACINGGGNHPKATNKATVSGSVVSTFTESPINGRVMATFSPVPGTPPGPGSFSCPSGQTMVLAAVSYTFTLTDTSNDTSIDLSASRTFFTF